MDGLLALDLWDIVIEVLRSTNNTVQPKHTNTQETGATLDSNTKAQKVKRRQKFDQVSDVDYVPTNTHSSHNESQLYIFEDNEARIKMIIKGRSPTMRHVSRTHTVALDWLFDRNNLDPKIQINFVNTKNQLADILTKVSQEMNGISLSKCLSDKSDQVGKQSAMSERGQKTTSNEGSPTAKAKPCLVSRDARNEEISSRSLGSLVNPGAWPTHHHPVMIAMKASRNSTMLGTMYWNSLRSRAAAPNTAMPETGGALQDCTDVPLRT